MPKETSVFSVAIFGFSGNDQNVLRSILGLSKNRPISYRFNEVSGKGAMSDLVILNGANSKAMTEWRLRPANTSARKAVIATDEPHDHYQTPVIKRPFVASKVLHALDQAVAMLEPKSAVNMAPPSPASEPPMAEKQPLRALVVDDSLVVRKQMELELQQLGLQVHLAESARKAQAYLKRSTYQIIFLDVLLPDGDGLSICKAIKKDRFHTHTPVFLLTGKSSPFDRLKGKVAGCDVYLTKPLQIQTLRNAIRDYLPTNERQSVPEDALVL